MKANEMLSLISKQWANTKDIQVLANVGRDKAMKIKKVIQKELLEKNWLLPNENYIPMPELVRHLRIDINYLKKLKGE